MPEPLIAPSFLFRYSLPCLEREPLWTPTGANLDERYAVTNLAELDGRRQFADVRAAWGSGGISFAVRVEGKKQPPWCRANRIEDSDGFHVWIDTRDTHNIHRAGRFCHRFVFLPSGEGPRLDAPVAEPLLINRARENPQPARSSALKVRAEKRIDGYRLECHISAAALTGFDPAEHGRLGFMYAIYDRELGEQTLHVGSEFPYEEDPSLWSTLELVREK